MSIVALYGLDFSRCCLHDSELLQGNGKTIYQMAHLKDLTPQLHVSLVFSISKNWEFWVPYRGSLWGDPQCFFCLLFWFFWTVFVVRLSFKDYMFYYFTLLFIKTLLRSFFFRLLIIAQAVHIFPSPLMQRRFEKPFPPLPSRAYLPKWKW